MFGASSEARETDQLGLFNEAEALGVGATCTLGRTGHADLGPYAC
ncbi:hypothetical protein [Paraburkholderia unamae]